jgi:hypothetical protein
MTWIRSSPLACSIGSSADELNFWLRWDKMLVCAWDYDGWSFSE